MINLPSLSKIKLFLSGILIFSLLISAWLPFSLAQAKSAFAYSSGKMSTYQRDVFEPAVFGTSEMNLESFTWESFKALLASISVFLSGTINDAYKNQLSMGAVGTVASLIPLLYANPPVSGIDYLAQVGSNLGLATPVHAQEGIGFRSLQPVLHVWQAFRNIAYVLFVIIFVLIGLAIMFRVRLNPQTVVGIQNAIPRLVIALILVTFSYAIAGFVYDLIFVLIYLSVEVLKISKLITLSGVGKDVFDWLLQSGNVGHLMLVVLISSLGNIIATIDSLVVGFFNPVGAVPILGEIVAIALQWTIGLALGIIISILVGILLLIVLLRLFWIILSAYIGIVLAVIIAPFQLLLGAIPAVEIFGFGAWMRGLVANMLVFPTTFLLLMLAHILMGPTTIPGTTITIANLFGLKPNVGYGDPSNAGFLPPLLGSGWFDPSAAATLIGLGIMLMIPGILNRIKETIKGRVPPLELFGRTEQAVAKGAFGYGAQKYIYPEEPKPGIKGRAARAILRTTETMGFTKRPQTETRE